MKAIVLTSLAVLAIGFGSAARAEDDDSSHYSCTKDKAICVGAQTYGYSEGIVHGTVVGVGDHEKISFKTDEGKIIELHEPEVALSNAGVCSPKAKDFCVGKTVAYPIEDGLGQVQEKILGVFQSEYVIIQTPDGDLDSFKASGLKLAASTDMGAYQNAINKFLELRESISGLDPKKGPDCDHSMVNRRLNHLAFDPKKELSPYLHTWKTSDEKAKAGNPWRDCSNPDYWNELIKTDANGKIVPECTPDTLYSWGPSVKIKDLENLMGAGGKWNTDLLQRPIFTVPTPTGSFAYGDIPMRIKLKPGMKFKIIKTEAGTPSWNNKTPCNDLTAQELKETVLVRVFKSSTHLGHEFIVCSSNVVQSWSFGTREQYDEMVKDVNWIQDPAHQAGAPIHNADYSTYLDDFNDVPQYLGAQIAADSVSYTEDGLRAGLQKTLDLSANGQGKVFVNPDSRTKDGAADLKLHFQTKTKSWFHDE